MTPGALRKGPKLIIENSLQFDLPHVNVAKLRRTARQHVKWQRRHDKTFDNDRMEYTYCLLKELERAGHVLLEHVAKELHRHLPSLTYKDCDTLVNAYMTPHSSYHEWEDAVLDVFLAY